MKLKIAARSSDLARIQAITVGEALRRSSPAKDSLQVEYAFRQSLGDLNQHDPLWKMPEKGVFTEDFRADLLSGACDLVVHSWKDLPVEARVETEIVATLPRADFRDLLLFKRTSAEKLRRGVGSVGVRILSSSPRRAYNLGPFLSTHLPQAGGAPHAVEFLPVRGNIPTRIRKWLEGEEDGLIVAKAALDRMLETADWPANLDEWSAVRGDLRDALSSALWMALPISANPPAAAQGALAIEIRRDRDDLREVLGRIHCADTFRAVTREREILKSYGGGCHQKIGVALLPRAYGEVFSLRGETDQGLILDAFRIEAKTEKDEQPRAAASAIWPANESERVSAFERVPLATKNPGGDLWVARAEALPADWRVSADQVVWTSGLETWRKLAARGVWVSGSAEGLGETENPRVESLLIAQRGRGGEFTKLTHTEGPLGGYPVLPTYALRPRTADLAAETMDLRARFAGRTHFYWMSGSLFEYCWERVPELRHAHHSCGPGNTHATLQRVLGPSRAVGIFLGLDEWKKEVLK